MLWLRRAGGSRLTEFDDAAAARQAPRRFAVKKNRQAGDKAPA